MIALAAGVAGTYAFGVRPRSRRARALVIVTMTLLVWSALIVPVL